MERLVKLFFTFFAEYAICFFNLQIHLVRRLLRGNIYLSVSALGALLIAGQSKSHLEGVIYFYITPSLDRCS